ncbi:XRE family transcriptional regulator [Streptomyces nigrescens]|uniref:XRE family transcriptional regulator n=1 Tax=Streptomyces nigrescens TaxID=1920 RepID=UPI003700D094
MAAVVQWTGREAALLGEAMRWSVREYAARLGVETTTVTRWRNKGSTTKLKPATAEMLDTLKGRCPPEALEVFYASLGGPEATSGPALGPATVTSHKFLPVYVGEDVDLIEGVSCSRGPGGLVRRSTPADHPDAAPESRLHLYECGVSVFHLVQRREVATLGDLAVWRYRTYASDLRWASRRLGDLLPAPHRARVPAFSYVLSAYLLEDSPWEGPNLRSALQLLTTPSVLVNRKHPEAATRLGDDVERALLTEGFEHADVHDFGSSAIALGLAGWSGVAYHPLAPERALPMDAIAALELDVQALWALSSYVLDEIELGRDPVVPSEFGWRFLRGANTRLTAARPQETAQHQLMREAVLATSQLPERLRTAQEALRESGI